MVEMDKFEKNIRNKYHHQSSPSVVDEIVLWDKISEQLPVERKPSFLKRSLWLLVLFFIFILGFIYLSHDMMIEESSLSTADALTKRISNKEAFSAADDQNFTQKESIVKTNSVSSSSSNSSLSKFVESETELASSFNKYDRNFILPFHASHTQSMYAKGPITELNTYEIQTPSTVSKTSINILPEVLKGLQSIKALPLNLLEHEKSTDINLEEEMIIEPIKENKHHRLILENGLVWQANRFNTVTELSTELNEQFDFDPGMSLSLTYQRTLYKNLYYSLGVRYQKSYVRFSNVTNWDTLMWRNEILNSELIPAVAERIVNHHNILTMVQIPLGFNYYKKFNKTHVNLSTGSLLNFIIKSQGKYLNDNKKIESYDYTIGGSTKFHFGAYISTGVDYRLSKPFLLGLSANFSMSKTNILKEVQLQNWSFFLNPNVRITYHLN